MKNLIARFLHDDDGQDLIEYGLLVGIITVAAVTAITSIGTKVESFYTDLLDKLSGAGGAP